MKHMKDMDVCLFVKNYLPPHIKNKIMHYTIKSIYNQKTYLLGDKKIKILNNFYNTKNKLCIYNLPLEINYIRIHRRNKIINMNNLLTITKTITTYISENQTEMYNAIGYMYINKNSDCKLYEKLNCIKYINKTTIEDDLTGTILHYNNYIELNYIRQTYKGNKNVLNSVNSKILYITPLNLLWKIKNYKISLKEIKLIASQNKIKGRSKLKTRQDYIKAFIKL